MTDEQELPADPILAYQLIPDHNQPTVVALAFETERGHSLFLATREILEDLGKDQSASPRPRCAGRPRKPTTTISRVQWNEDDIVSALKAAHRSGNAARWGSEHL
jgi:hypothetical protein